MACVGCIDENAGISIAQGESKTITIVVYERCATGNEDQDNVPRQDLTGMRLILSVLNGSDASPTNVPFIVKDTALGAASLLILDQTDEDTQGYAEAYLVSADSIDVDVGTYQFDVWLLDGAGGEEQIRPLDAFSIRGRARARS